MASYTPDIEDPYPQGDWLEITDFRYETPLIVRREAKALRQRRNKKKDAEYIVAAPYTISYKLDGRYRRVTVPAGMLTDLASAPRLAALAGIGRVGPHLEASIVHDYLYIAWQYLLPAGEAQRAGHYFADRLFLEGMRSAQVFWPRRIIIYLAVRFFGWSVYKDLDPDAFVDLDTLR